MLLNKMMYQVCDQLQDQVLDQVRDQVEDQIENQVKSQVLNQGHNHVWINFKKDKKNNKLYTNIIKQLKEQI